MAAMGVGIGVIASIVVANLIATQLFGTDPTDLPTFGGMIVQMGGMAGGYLRARSTSRIDLMVALRSE